MESGVILRGMLVSLTSKRGQAFVADCTRAAKGLLRDSEVQMKYGITNAEWQHLLENKQFAQAIRAEASLQGKR